jgi:hypothetical protein
MPAAPMMRSATLLPSAELSSVITSPMAMPRPVGGGGMAVPDVGDFVGEHRGQRVLAGDPGKQAAIHDDVAAQRGVGIDRRGVAVMQGQLHVGRQVQRRAEAVGQLLQSRVLRPQTGGRRSFAWP